MEYNLNIESLQKRVWKIEDKTQATVFSLKKYTMATRKNLEILKIGIASPSKETPRNLSMEEMTFSELMQAVVSRKLTSSSL